MRFRNITIGLCALMCFASLAGCKTRSEMPPLDEGSSVTYSSSSSASSSIGTETSGTSSASGGASANSESKSAESSATHVHNYEVKETVEPNCFRNGHTLYECECGDSNYTEVPATGHKYSAKTIEPDCVNQGCTRYTCANCGESYDEDFVPPLDHKYGAWTTVNEPTTSSEGEEQATCSRCGKTISSPIPPIQKPVSNDDFTSEVIRLVNIERADNGLSPLSENSVLGDFAQTRSSEIMQDFSHTRPDGSSPLKYVLGLDGIRTCGENIAMGQPTPEAVVEAWMNSPGHRANILKEDFTMIGVGCSFGGGAYYWTQIFGG